MTIYQGYTFEHRKTRDQARAHEALCATEKYTANGGEQKIADKVFYFIQQEQPAAAALLWSAYCQRECLCLHCGGKLTLAQWGGGYGQDPADVTEQMVCQQCGKASDWQPDEIETDEELPI